MGKILAAYGGGFKPPTAGHFEIVKRALEEFPEIDEFTVFVGGKVRDGIEQTEAVLVWDIYKRYLANKVKIEPVDTPIREILRLAKDNPQDTIYFVIGYREGRQDDLDDVAARTGNLKDKYDNIEVKVIPTYDPNMSGTNARIALKKSEEEFIEFLPNEVKEKSEIYSILRPTEQLEEELTQEIPEFFYHATYRALIPSIMKTGLDTREASLAWADSKPGIVYLASDRGVAESYAEAAEEVSDEIYDSGIVMLKIPSKNLDLSKLHDDSNVLEDESDTYEYHGQIPWNKLQYLPRHLNENATYSNYINYRELISDLVDHMLEQGRNISPLPDLEFIDGDTENAENFFGKTAYYDPNTKTIVLYTEGRHPKDIVRSFAHEMVHHTQNLEGRLGDIQTTDTTEDENLDAIEREAYQEGNMIFRNWTDSIDGDINSSIEENKDYFGINKFIKEVAEEVLNEGKYDSLVTKLAGWTLNSWKDDFKEGANKGKFNVEIGPGKDFDYPHLDFKYKSTATFGGIYNDQSFARPLVPEVVIKMTLDVEELPRMWEQISMDLRNTIRHEIEHLMQSGPNVKKGKEKERDYSEREEIKTGKKKWWKIWRKTLGTPDYYKLEKEVDANLQGLYLKAKKQRTPLKDVIDNYVKYTLNLPVDEQEEVKRIWAERAPSLNIPLEENKKQSYKIFSDMDGVLTDFDTSFKKYSDGIAPSDYEKKYGKEKFWELIDGQGKVGFWVGMPWMVDGQKYWDYIKDYDVELLSSPSRSATSRLGKRLWVRNNMPGIKLTLAQAKHKQNYAAPNHILIDDRKSNIDQWRSQGGIGILHTSASDTINKLKELGL
jgi:hypothetical protein